MKNRIISTGIVGLLVIGGFVGLFMATDLVSAPGPTYVSGPIVSDTTWYFADTPYIVTGDIIVDNGTTLTIEAGVTVKFDGLYSLILNGTLNATGTFGQPIVFTSNQSVPAKSDWHRIRLQGANNTMDYCEISYGNYALYIMGEDTNNNISNCNVHHNTGDGIYLKETTNNTIYNTTVSFSSSNGITVLISEYNLIYSSYVRQNNAFGIYLRSSNNNTIESTNVSNNQGGGIELGLSSENIRMKNVTVFQNYDNGIDFNGNSYNNVTDSWIIGNEGIGIDLGSSSEHQRIENCTVRDNVGSGIDLDGSSYVNITDCNISKNKGNAGIYSASSVTNVTITNLEIWNNSEDGIEIYGANFVNISNSNISENVRNGIAFNGSEIQEKNNIQNCTIIKNGNNGIYLYTYSPHDPSYIQYINVSYNIIYLNNLNGIYYETHTDYYYQYDSYSYIQYNNVYNNTIYLNNQNGVCLKSFSDDYSYIQYNSIYNNTIYSNNQNSINFNSTSYYHYPYILYNNIHNNLIHSNNKNGIFFSTNPWTDYTFFQNNNISFNIIYLNSQNGIYFYCFSDYGSYLQNNNIYSNTIYSNSQNGIYFNCESDEWQYSNLQNNNIYSNTIYLNSQNGIYFKCYSDDRSFYLEYNNIYSNTIFSNNQNGIYFYAYSDTKSTFYPSYLQYNSIYSNTIYSNNQNGIVIYGNVKNSDLHIQNNKIYANTMHLHTSGRGIYVQSDDIDGTWENSHFYKNTITSNLIGIELVRIISHIIYINNISNNLNDGILLNSSESNTISYNVMSNNNWSAINLTNSSNNNKIQNNNITSNNQTGIFVNSNSNYNTITRNNILDNLEGGVNITDSFDNYLHHNNFKNNAQNAFDSTTQLNDWDDSVEGNWWDDYTGFDANGDGIGDIPYDVPGGGSKDWYPIINPANITAPHVEYTNPEDSEVNVSITPYISITFSNKMNQTATENAISMSGGLTPINFTWSNGDMTVTFEPSLGLGSSTTYTITISISAKDVLGNHLEEIYQFSFETKDVIPPEIIATLPFHSSIDIALDTNIVVTFSEPMNTTTVAFTCSPDPGGWDVSWSNMNSVATYTHDDFGSQTEYTFEITGGKDIGGNDLIAGPVSNPWMFTTLDVIGPEITTTSPANDSTGVLLTANVVVTFSEQMNTTSVTYSCTPDPGGWVVDWSNEDKTATYSHNSFTTQTIYTFHISAGKDMAGNTLNPSIPNPWSFTTIDSISPLITATSPSNGSINVQLNADIIVTFNEPMDNMTVAFICNPNPGGWSVSWSGGNTVATYSHYPLTEKTDYIFQITGGKDMTGNDLIASSVPNPWSFRTQDFSPPQISATLPADSSADITLDTEIVVTFSEEMDPLSLNYVCSPDPGGWSTSWNAGNNIVTFSHNLFDSETTYTFQINTGKDISGNDLNPSTVPNPWSFTTIAGDITAPEIISTSPAQSEVNVDLDENIIVTFSEAMNTSSVHYTCTPNPGGWSESWSNGNTVVTYSHGPFEQDTTHVFHIYAAEDVIGNDIESGTIPNPLSFTTLGDIEAPQIISTSPSDYETGVNLTKHITVTFSETMDTSSIDYSCSPDPGGWFVSWSNGDTVLTFSHNSFELGTMYLFHITEGKDLAGNDLTSGAVPRSWYFITISVDHIIVTPSKMTITLNQTVVLIAQAYDSQNNLITGVTYSWSVNNNLGSVYSRNLNIATFQASSNTGTCAVNVTAGGKNAGVSVTIISEEPAKKETGDKDPDYMMWIWFLIIVIVVLFIINLKVALRKKKPEIQDTPKPVEEGPPPKEMPEVTQEEVKEPEPSPPPKVSTTTEETSEVTQEEVKEPKPSPTPEEPFDEDDIPPPPED